MTALITGILIAAVSITPADSVSYFPLGEGNTWTYFQTLEPPGGPVDTLWNGPFTVDGTVFINDTLYSVTPHPFAFSDTLRADEEGRIWARVDGVDQLLYHFSLEDEAVYPFTAEYEVTVTRGDASVHAGAFDDVVTLSFDIPGAVDDERSFTFARGVGLVQVYGTMGDYYELHSAVVGGREITSSEKPQADAAGILVEAYPNPFRDIATIVVSARGAVRVDIFDSVGRRIDKLGLAYCMENCRFTWKAEHIATGLYFARISSDWGSRTVPLIGY